MRLDVLSLFPKYFESPLKTSILKRALEKKLLEVNLINIRDFAKDKHKSVDDRPYGGGPGMVLMCDPLKGAILSVYRDKAVVVYLSPQGKKLEANDCEEYAKFEHIILICGHYEGIDERIIRKYVDIEVSVGDFVLTSGCPAALTFIDAVSRFVPGVIGNEDAAYQDTFQLGRFDTPHYTRPKVFEGMRVPEELLSGHHLEIEKWRKEQGLKKTRQFRPDLLDEGKAG
jgi:tRNA (guanine37-N1)-methyltransferase